MSYRILIDLSHNEQVEEFPEFSLEDEDLSIEYIDKNDVFEEFNLEDYDILFIGYILHSTNGKKDKFSPDQLTSIKKYVGEGGSLLLTSGPGGDQDIPMKLGSIRVLYKLTGVKRFWNGTILEAPNNFMVERKNLLINDLYAHPITKGVSELVFPSCTFLSLSDEEVDDLIYTSEKAEFKYFVDDDVDEVGQVPVCVVSEFYNGRSVTFGSSEWLLEDNEYGIDAGDNLKLLKNVINWLNFEI
jgi:uncharacterized membrane protein